MHHKHVTFTRAQTRTSYPLASRGLVAITGRNDDDDSSESNGAGKTSLVTALLWAMKVGFGCDSVCVSGWDG
jgi:hypothetical protein